MNSSKKPLLGCGVGLRSKHYPVITSEWPQAAWFEAITENYMDTGGRPLAILEKVRSRYPIALHGVALSIGSTDPLNQKYLERLKALISRIDPIIVSDHLCWSGVGGNQLHDLLPLPFTEESLRHVVSRVSQIQEFLGREILIENVSTYITYTHSEMKEWEFLAEAARRSGCRILLDINNIYVNSRNHQFDPVKYLEHLSPEKIWQFHLAGHIDKGNYLFDTHNRPVIEEVWALYEKALQLYGQVSTLIEWDDDIPEFPRLMEECQKAQSFYDQYKGHIPQLKEKTVAVMQNSEEVKAKYSLAEIQDWMRKKIQPSGFEKTHDEKQFLNPQGGEAGEDRMAVYAGGYLARIHDALLEVYERVHAVVGGDLFHSLSEAYAYHCPSHNYNLNVAGKNFPEFIKNLRELESFPFLSELARLEWQVAESFHAYDQPPFVPADLSAIAPEDWENLKIQFQPSVAIFETGWPVFKIWKDYAEGRVCGPKEIKPRQEFLLLGRRGNQVRCESLQEAQFKLVKSLLSGKTLGEACEILMEDDEGDYPVAEWFSRWTQEGLIVSCSSTKAFQPSSPIL